MKVDFIPILTMHKFYPARPPARCLFHMFFCAAILAGPTARAAAQWTTEVSGGAVHASYRGEHQLSWQLETVGHPKGSDAFLPSAFFHPLKTPAGFQWTAALPADHIHHLGLWWPWKYITVDGQQYNCWELQKGEGAHHALSATFIDAGPTALEWQFENEILVRRSGDETGPPVTKGIPVIHETVHARIARHGENANVIDLKILQTPVDQPVTINQHHYSGFAWRGPETWDKSNSVLTTSRGHTRDQANGSGARWVLVTGPGKDGATVSVLIMSAAPDIADTPERMRVWHSKIHHGTPFVNFNPVQAEALPLDADHPAVFHRQYRVIAADREITTEEAETEWRAWRASAARHKDIGNI